MRAGRLRHRVAIQAKSQAPDDMNQMVDTWSTAASVWADIKPMRAAEGYEAQQNVPRCTHEITMRYTDAVDANMRIVYDSRNFYIQGIRNIEERNFMLILECNERV